MFRLLLAVVLSLALFTDSAESCQFLRNVFGRVHARRAHRMEHRAHRLQQCGAGSCAQSQQGPQGHVYTSQQMFVEHEIRQAPMIVSTQYPQWISDVPHQQSQSGYTCSGGVCIKN